MYHTIHVLSLFIAARCTRPRQDTPKAVDPPFGTYSWDRTVAPCHQTGTTAAAARVLQQSVVVRVAYAVHHKTIQRVRDGGTGGIQSAGSFLSSLW